MSSAPVRLTRPQARRIVLRQQRLAGRLARASPDAVVRTIRELGFVQWDPVPIVAPSHLLSLAARLDRFRPALLERLLWTDRKVLEHWTPMASLVLTEDYPLYRALMQRYPASMGRSWGIQGVRAAEFLRRHRGLRTRILRQLGSGPMRAHELRERIGATRRGSDWEPSSDVDEMLFHLGMRGEVMVVGHDGPQNLWGLAEEFLPSWTPREELSIAEFERRAAERSLRALGVGCARDIHFYFVRGRYRTLEATLSALEAEGRIRRVEIDGVGARPVHYIPEEVLDRLDSVSDGAWEPRTSLLPPFDTLLGSPTRLQRLFDFAYVREQFLPKEKRKYGTYVLPIVLGDRIVGRIDPQFDRAAGLLRILSIHAEPSAPEGREPAEAISEAIGRLARDIGAARIELPSSVPREWAGFLR